MTSSRACFRWSGGKGRRVVDPAADDAYSPLEFHPAGIDAGGGGGGADQGADRVSGTVLDAGRRVSGLTGQSFTVAVVRSAGFEASLCLAASDHPDLPAPGNIISGTVVLSAAIDSPLLDATQA
jgi:hypothetical protein